MGKAEKSEIQGLVELLESNDFRVIKFDKNRVSYFGGF